MYCPKCAAPVPVGMGTCPYCGAPIAGGKASASGLDEPTELKDPTLGEDDAPDPDGFGMDNVTEFAGTMSDGNGMQYAKSVDSETEYAPSPSTGRDARSRSFAVPGEESAEYGGGKTKKSTPKKQRNKKAEKPKRAGKRKKHNDGEKSSSVIKPIHLVLLAVLAVLVVMLVMRGGI